MDRVLSGQIEASLAASTGVEDSDRVVKYLLAGADVVMTTSALLRNGPQYLGHAAGRSQILAVGSRYRLGRGDPWLAQSEELPQPG
jgi:dihydroorotate dehydrogenase